MMSTNPESPSNWCWWLVVVEVKLVESQREIADGGVCIYKKKKKKEKERERREEKGQVG